LQESEKKRMKTSQLPVPPKLKAKILVLLDNLFFAGKINQAASQTETKVIYAKTSENALKLARTEHPAQIIVDLDAATCAPIEFISSLKADTELQSIPTLGFVSHVNLDRQQQARDAGCDRVMARSAFDRNLAAILNQES
jgi:PleD family two-component response regulator